MARIAFYPNSSGTPFIPGKTYQIPEGGTGATTVADALIALGGISKATAGQVGGPVALDALACAPVSCYPTGVGQSYTFTGPTALSGGATSSNTYTLTNYDAYTTYTLTPLSGSINSTSNGAGAVTLGADVSTFTYIPPLRGTGTDGFKITTSTDSTGRSFSVTVNNSVVTTPSISMAFTTNLSEYPTITGSSYGGGTNTLSGQAMTKSRWQIASDSGFTTVLKDKSVTGTLTSCTLVSANGALAHGTTYYARVQYACTYNGTDIWSDWSTGVAISTMAEFTLSVPSTNPPIGGQANTLTIQNYDSAATYSVSTSSGCSSVTVSGSTVNFTPNTAGTSYSITISDGHTGITQSGAVTASVVNTPSIASGVTNGQTGLGSSVTMVGSTPSGTGIYSTISSYTATWNLYTNSSYTGTPTTQTVSNATSVTFSGLSANTTYYAQVRYSVGTGVSSFSHGSGSAFSFTTKSSFIPTNQIQVIYGTTSGDYLAVSGFSTSGNIVLFNNNRTLYTGLISLNHRNSSGLFVWDTTFDYKTRYYYNSYLDSTLSRDGNSVIIRNFESSGWTDLYVANPLGGIQTTFTQKIVLPFYTSGGLCLSYDGNTLLVGNPTLYYGGTANVGIVYVYTRANNTGQFSQVDTLLPNNPVTNAHAEFGGCITISDDGSTILVTSNREDGGNYMGSVYVFMKVSGYWTIVKRITSSNRAYGDYFGNTTALNYDGSVLVIGTMSGQVYVYTKPASGWTGTPTEAKLTGLSSYFGKSVAISSDGNTILVGDTGRVLFFTKPLNGWAGVISNTSYLTVTGSSNNQSLGVALSGDGSAAMITDTSWSFGSGQCFNYT